MASPNSRPATAAPIPDAPRAHTLTAANEAAHHLLLEAYEYFLEAATVLDPVAMSGRLQWFEALLTRHMRIEDDTVVGLFATCCPDRRGEIARIDGDHRILLRCLESVKGAVAVIARAPEPRRELVRRLGVLDRLREVMEHHTLRESTRFYPFLDQRLVDARREELARLLVDGCAATAT